MTKHKWARPPGPWVRPPYILAFCPRHVSARALALPSELRTYLGVAERDELAALPERRRLDRLAGRLAAKRALATHFRTEHGWQAEPRELVCFNDEAGRPLLRLPKGAPAPPSFSISHCAQGGAAAVAAPGQLAPGPGRRVGVDVETIVARPTEVIAFVAAPSELSAAARLLTDPEAQARLWTGKEAALKLLGLGLNADARDVRLNADAVTLSGLPAEAWRALGSPRMRLAYERIEGAMLAVAYTED